MSISVFTGRAIHTFVQKKSNGYLVQVSKVGSNVAGCIGAHLARGKAKSVEHVMSWSLDSNNYLYLYYALYHLLDARMY